MKNSREKTNFSKFIYWMREKMWLFYIIDNNMKLKQKKKKTNSYP